MKPYSNTGGGTVQWAQLLHLSGIAATTVCAIASRIGRGAKNVLVQTQIARLQSVLHGMDDDLLKQIGITRSGISKYAEDLITNKHDGL